LHLGPLVVVGEDDGVALARELADLVLQGGYVLGREVRRGVKRGHGEVHGAGSRRSERSREGAECVSAPTDMKSTPVSATSLIVSRSIPPLASSSARPATRPTIARICAGLMLSSRICSAPAASASSTSASSRHSTSTRVPAGTPAWALRTASPTPPAIAAWFSLMR